jgi:hypothetical protein
MLRSRYGGSAEADWFLGTLSSKSSYENSSPTHISEPRIDFSRRPLSSIGIIFAV